MYFQLILLQEDGQNSKGGQAVQQPANVTKAVVSPTGISQAPMIVPQQPTQQAAPSGTPPAKPTIINLSSLPSGLTLVGATKPATQVIFFC